MRLSITLFVAAISLCGTFALRSRLILGLTKW